MAKSGTRTPEFRSCAEVSHTYMSSSTFSLLKSLAFKLIREGRSQLRIVSLWDSEHKTALHQSSRSVCSRNLPWPDRLGPFPNHGNYVLLCVPVPRRTLSGCLQVAMTWCVSAHWAHLPID